MYSTKIFLCGALILMSAVFGSAQTATNPPAKNSADGQTVSPTKSSPAYAELLFRQTERESELEELTLDYTEEFPKVKELRYELGLLKKEMSRVAAVKPSEAGKLTLALGKLLVRRVELEVELWNLKNQYADEQPEVRRTKRKIEAFDKSIKEILP